MKDLKAQLFIDPPADFAAAIEVATCYIRSGDEILFVQRRPDKSQGSLWGIPGGKVEKGKEIESEMIREIMEETAIDLADSCIESFGSVYIRCPGFDYIYHMFGVLLNGPRPKIILNEAEHVDHAWWSLEEGLAHPLILFEEACTFLVWNEPFFEGCPKPVLSGSLQSCRH